MTTFSGLCGIAYSWSLTKASVNLNTSQLPQRILCMQELKVDHLRINSGSYSSWLLHVYKRELHSNLLLSKHGNRFDGIHLWRLLFYSINKGTSKELIDHWDSFPIWSSLTHHTKELVKVAPMFKVNKDESISWALHLMAVPCLNALVTSHL